MNRQEPGSTPGSRPGQTSPVIGDGDNGATRYESETRYQGETRYEADPKRDGESVPGLVKRLASDLSTLFSQELALAKAEMTSAVKDAGSGVSSMAIGGSILYAGLLFILGGVMLLLAYWVALPFAALIVGVAVAIIGAIMLQSGKKRVQADAFKPDRTIDSVRKDADMAKRKMQ